MKYVEYAENGAILKTGIAPQRDIDYMMSLGQLLLVLPDNFLGSDETHYVENGQIVEMPAKPSIYHVFDLYSKKWIDPRTPETQWPIVRYERDKRLASTDWTQLPDVPISTKEAWAVYRQALRDITLQADPFNIVWPTPVQ